ncbi:MAG: DUF488 domain-containing protein [Betaproteobacteria bacterium]|nr:DUF488 domain-containing protein [Betaproteobacteria bacterium]
MAHAAVLTIGHSTRSLAELIELLKAQGAAGVVDVRTIPRSRTNPQFDRDALSRDLEAAGIGYRHAPGLGGLRRARPDSPNMGWHNASFRGFADYMQTPEFADALRVLIEDSQKERLALMCAEAVPWRCHRSLIADALAVRGIAVEHIVGKGRTQPHALTPWAAVEGTTIVYPLAKAERYEAARAAAPHGAGKPSHGSAAR